MSFEFSRDLPRRHHLYTIRSSVENEAIRALRKMHYLKIACPYKQGKTSFLNRICVILEREKTIVRLSAIALDRSSEAGWYDSLCSRVRDQLVYAGLGAASSLPIPANHTGWEGFLHRVERLGSSHDREVVLVIDDLHVAVGLRFAFEFLMQMLLVYTAPSARSRRTLTFVVAGAFDDLDFVSPAFLTGPLKCAVSVQLRDFDTDEVTSLVSKGPFPRDRVPELAQQIHYWTGGQPYLTQVLCSLLPENATPADVGDCVLSLRTEGDLRAHIVELTESDPAVKACFQSILRGDHVAYSKEIPEQRRLQQFGLIDREPTQKYWVIRNPLYRYLFNARSEHDVFVSYRHGSGRLYAEVIQKDLEDHGWKVFRDDKLGPGLFRDGLLHLIQSTPVFLPVLSRGTLDRHPPRDERQEEDILRLEVGHALARTEHIIPVLMDGFQFPPDEELGNLSGIRSYNGADFGQGLNRGLKRLRELISAVVPPRNKHRGEGAPPEDREATRGANYVRGREASAEAALLAELGRVRRTPGEADRRTESERNAPGNVSDPVHISLSVPRSVPTGDRFLVDVWAHLARQRLEVERMAEMASPGRDLAIRPTGPVWVARGLILEVRLHIEDLIVDKPVNFILWEGEIGSAGFAVTVPPDARAGRHAGSAIVRVEGIRTLSVPFEVEVQNQPPSIDLRIQSREMPQRAFASYSTDDTTAVLARIQGMCRRLPALHVFWAPHSLSCGVLWEQEVRRQINDSDVFYLFWSANAAASREVENEWKYALDRRGLDFIEPVPLVDPSVVKPPPELSGKHFSDWTIPYLALEELRRAHRQV